MKTYFVAFDQVARVAHVSERQASIPSNGVTALGSFKLPEDTEDDLGYERPNRTIFHEIRDKLFAIGEQNMQAVQIMVA